MLRLLSLCIFLCFNTTALARMYQWVEPDTHTTQLSGKPPTWYRSAEEGPRVFVFENGRVIDDTGINVSVSVRQRLRQQAFLAVEKDKSTAKEKLMQAERLKAAIQQKRLAEEAGLEQVQVVPVKPITDTEPVPEQATPVHASTEIEDARALIAEWERLRIEEARKLIESIATGSVKVPDS